MLTILRSNIISHGIFQTDSVQRVDIPGTTAERKLPKAPNFYLEEGNKLKSTKQN